LHLLYADPENAYIATDGAQAVDEKLYVLLSGSTGQSKKIERYRRVQVHRKIRVFRRCRGFLKIPDDVGDHPDLPDLSDRLQLLFGINVDREEPIDHKVNELFI